MDSTIAIRALGALAQEHRLGAFKLLVQAGAEGMAAGALAEALGIAPSSLSFHLAQLANAGLISQARHSRSIIYTADYAAMNALMGYLTENCCGGVPCAPDATCQTAPLQEHPLMSDRVYNVMFLCTGNSARSILAESILNRDGQGRFRAFSAGSQPKGEVHPMALKVLADYRYPHEGFRSKNWNEFATPDAPKMDFVITVCDNAAGEACPVWPGQPMTAHWGIDDPAAVEGEGQMLAFIQAFQYLRRRIELFLALPITALDSLALATSLKQIGSEAGATDKARA